MRFDPTHKWMQEGDVGGVWFRIIFISFIGTVASIVLGALALVTWMAMEMVYSAPWVLARQTGEFLGAAIAIYTTGWLTVWALARANGEL